MFRTTTIILLLILGSLEYRFLLGKDSIFKVKKLQAALEVQQLEVAELQHRNTILKAKIKNMKQYPEAIEEQARYELGMVKTGEKYYQVIESIE